MITTPTIMYLGFAMHKIARMGDKEYRPVKTKKRMPIVNRGAVRDYEEAEDNGEEDPMIAEEIEPDKPEKKEKGKTAMGVRGNSGSVSVVDSQTHQIQSVYCLLRHRNEARWAATDSS